MKTDHREDEEGSEGEEERALIGEEVGEVAWSGDAGRKGNACIYIERCARMNA